MPNRRRRLAAALAVLTTALLSAALAALAATPMVAAHPVAPQPGPTPLPDFTRTHCLALSQLDVQPGALLLGETIAVTRAIAPMCAGMALPIHIVLVLDGTASMAGRAADERDDAVRVMLDAIEPRLAYLTRVAIVGIDDEARLLCGFTHRRSRLDACAASVGAAGEAGLDEGIDLAVRTLKAGMRSWPGLSAEDMTPAIIVVSDGADPDGCSRADRLAASARRESAVALVISVCTGPGCDLRCMRGLAAPMGSFIQARDRATLAAIHDRINVFCRFHSVKSVTITETLPADVELVAAESASADLIPSEDERILVWSARYIPTEGVTLTYRLRPQVPGYVALFDAPHGTFRDSRGLIGRFELARPWVRVVAPAVPERRSP